MDPLVVRYDANANGMIDKTEVIKAIKDYLYGGGDEAISKAEVIRLIIPLSSSADIEGRPGQYRAANGAFISNQGVNFILCRSTRCNSASFIPGSRMIMHPPQE